jgi:hypothetical protein
VQGAITNRKENAFVIQLSLARSTKTFLGQGQDAIFGMRTSSSAGLSSSVAVTATQSDADTTALQLIEESQPLSVSANASQMAGTVSQVTTQGRVDALCMNDKNPPQFVTNLIPTTSSSKHTSTIPTRRVGRDQLRAEAGTTLQSTVRVHFRLLLSAGVNAKKQLSTNA